MSGPPINPYASPQMPSQPPLPPGAQQFAPCPSCRNPYGKRVGFTWWGGALGPWLFTHVKCLRCSKAYNGKTGQSNDTNIVIYVVVVAGIGLAIGLVGGLMSVFS